MKKFCIIIITLLINMVAFAQDGIVMIDEHFDGHAIPEGWAAYGLGSGNWSYSNTNYAGIEAGELHLSHNFPNTFNGTARFSAPALDLTGVNSIIVQFNFYFENELGTHKIGIATSKNGGSTWHNCWQQSYSTTGKYYVDELLTSSDFNKEDVLVAIFFTGNSEFFHDLYFDDIKIIALKNNDASIDEINILDKLPMSDNRISFTITNSGHDAINNFEAEYYFNDNEIVTEFFETYMESLDTRTFTFMKKKNLNPDKNNCIVEITKVNGVPDDDETNNHLQKPVFVGYGSTQRTVMIEHFSSCTCPHCPSADAIMATLTANNPDKFTYVKYEMDWPGLGDPYYTEEGGAMKDYYQVYGIPDLFFDSKDIYYQDINQRKFDSLYASHSFADIKGTFTVTGNTVNINVDVISHFDMNGYRLMVSVNEKTTTQNNRDEFHHVMMKMIPDPYGTAIDLNAKEAKHFEFTQDMSGTFVEEMNDLEVAVWIQKRSTKEIVNSHFMYESTTAVNPVSNIQIIDNQDRTLSVVWNTPSFGEPTGYDLYINGTKVLSNTSQMSYTFEANENTYYVAEVVAIYNSNVSIKKIADLFVPMSVDEVEITDAMIYPNPIDNQLVIISEKINEISIFNVGGQIVFTKKFNSESSVTLDTGSWIAGVYFVKISTESGSMTKKAIKE